MSVLLEFFSIIIPRKIIDPVYPGGSQSLIQEMDIPECSYDENLVRFTARDSIGIGEIIEIWTNRGLRDVRKRKGKRAWIDLCVVDSSGEPTLPCKWIKTENGKAEYIG